MAGGLKYRNKPTEVNGTRFASKREAARYKDLLWLKSVGKVTDLVLQKRYPIKVNGQLVTTYVADFVYTTDAGESIVEDAKGFKTQVYSIKRKLMKAVHNIDVVEV